MIDFNTVRYEIEHLLSTEFTTTPIQYENTRIDSSTSEYISLHLDDRDANPFGIGSSVRLINGILTVCIFTKLGSGIQKSRSIAGEIEIILKSSQLPSIYFYDIELSSVGQVDGTNFYQQNLTIQYSYQYAGEPDQCLQ